LARAAGALQAGQYIPALAEAAGGVHVTENDS